MFFFDGEKIAELAEDESGNILRTAVRRLLGLDLISKLRNDLMIFVKRQQSSQLASSQQQQIAELEKQSKELACQTEALLESADFAKSRIEFLSKDITHYEGLLNAQGALLPRLKRRKNRKSKRC